MSVERRRQMIEPEHPQLSIVRQCELVSISRSGFYHRPETVSGLVDFVVSRALSCIGIDAGVLPRWGEGKEE
jgi:3-polyprenyl-4-hydroxybenzoate decarboxylase